MTEFATALNNQHHAEMVALSGADATNKLKQHHDGRMDALERRLAKVEAKLDASGVYNAAAAAPGALPPAPAADTDPAA